MDESEDDQLADGGRTAAHAVFEPAVVADLDADASDADAYEDVDEAEDEEDERKGVSFATKALVIGAAWVLLVLFLIGQFSGDDDPGAGPVGLDQAADAAGGDEVTAGEQGLEEEPVDVDGDGEIEPGEPGYGSTGGVEGASAGGAAGGSGGSGTSGGSSGGTSGDDGSGGDAAPVALPGGGSTTTTTRSGGGSATTTTTAKPGGGGGGSSTTAPPTTSAPATTQPPPAGPPVVTISGDCSFDRDTLSISRGTTVRFVNDTDHDVKLRFAANDRPEIESGDDYDREFGAAGVYAVGCERAGDDDTVMITVT